MNTLSTRTPARRWIGWGVVLATALISAGSVTPRGAQAQVESANRLQLGEELQSECAAQLEQLGKAIARYREDRGELPLWLSDLLSGGYVEDAAETICPLTRKTGETPDLRFYFPDPELPTSYLYEFNPRLVDPERGLTMREWKLRQVKFAGDRVPMVRCTLHGHVLNLSVGGKVFESDLDWEKDIEDRVVRAKISLGWDGGPVPGAPDQPLPDNLVGTSLSPLRLELLGGGILDSETFSRNKVTVLYLWTTRCGSCTRVFPWLEAYGREYAPRGVAVATINLDGPAEAVWRLLMERELDLVVALDSRGDTLKNFPGMGLPATVLVDAQGIIIYGKSGMNTNYREDLREAIEAGLR